MLNPAYDCYSQELFASKLKGFEIQVSGWMENIPCCDALTSGLLFYFFKELLSPLGEVPSHVLCSEDIVPFMSIFDSDVVRDHRSD